MSTTDGVRAKPWTGGSISPSPLKLEKKPQLIIIKEIMIRLKMNTQRCLVTINLGELFIVSPFVFNDLWISHNPLGFDRIWREHRQEKPAFFYGSLDLGFPLGVAIQPGEVIPDCLTGRLQVCNQLIYKR
jgi:hypothetical protein